MADVWPSGAISESNLDQGSDSRALARADLLQAVQQINLIREARGAANGIPQLDASGLVPITQLPAQAILGAIQFYDGAGSGLDADLLDGLEATAFVKIDGSQALSAPSTLTAGWTIGRRTTTNSARARAVTLKATNTPAATAAGYGVELRAVLGNAAGTEVNAGYVAWDWTDPTNASEDAALVLGHMVAGTLAEALRVVDRKLQIAEQSGTPSGAPPTGSWWIYPKSGGLALMDDGGSEALLTSGGATDHSTLLNLTTGDPHTQYFRPDGARPMTANLPLGAFAVLSTDLGADPAAPSAGQVKWYTKGGQLYYRNSSAVVGPIIAGGVTDHGALSGLSDDDHTQYLLRQPTADVAINDAGNDVNFRIEGNTAADLFNLDAGNDAIGINVAPGSTARLELVAGTGRVGVSLTATDGVGLAATTTTATTLTAAGQAALFVGTRSVGSAPSVAALKLSDSGAAGFRLLDLDGLASTDLLRAKVGSIEAFKLLAGEAVFNDTGSNYDLRVEGDTKANLLFVDASADAVNVNCTLSVARLNIEADGMTGLYALTGTAGAAAILAESQVSATYALKAVASVADGWALYALSTREQTAYFLKDLQGLTPASGQAVAMEVYDASDTAAVLTLKTAGSGDFLTCYDGSDTAWLRFLSTGGAYWKYLASDMATPPSGMWGIFCKVDGWYQIAPDGTVKQLGSGGGVVTSAHNAERKPDHYEEEVTTVSGQAYVDTTIAAPAGSYVERVLVRCTAATSGGVHVGTEGNEERYGASVGGNVGDTNLNDALTPAPSPVGATAMTVRLTSAGGTFATSTGKYRVTIFFVRFTAAAD